MKKLIQKLRCLFGFHVWDSKHTIGTNIEVLRCRHCGIFCEKDTLLDNHRFYTGKK